MTNLDDEIDNVIHPIMCKGTSPAHYPAELFKAIKSLIKKKQMEVLEKVGAFSVFYRNRQDDVDVIKQLTIYTNKLKVDIEELKTNDITHRGY